MMRVSLILGVVFLQAIYAFAYETPDWLTPEIMELIKPHKEKCMSKFGTSQEIIEDLNEGNLSNDRSLTCYIHCLLNEFDVIDEVGNLNVEMIKADLPENMKVMGTMALDQCSNKRAADVCDTVFEIAKCIQEVGGPELLFMV